MAVPLSRSRRASSMHRSLIRSGVPSAFSPLTNGSPSRSSSGPSKPTALPASPRLLSNIDWKLGMACVIDLITCKCSLFIRISWTVSITRSVASGDPRSARKLLFLAWQVAPASPARAPAVPPAAPFDPPVRYACTSSRIPDALISYEDTARSRTSLTNPPMAARARSSSSGAAATDSRSVRSASMPSVSSSPETPPFLTFSPKEQLRTRSANHAYAADKSRSAWPSARNVSLVFFTSCMIPSRSRTFFRSGSFWSIIATNLRLLKGHAWLDDWRSRITKTDTGSSATSLVRHAGDA